jgi:hypothetical protein
MLEHLLFRYVIVNPADAMDAVADIRSSVTTAYVSDKTRQTCQHGATLRTRRASVVAVLLSVVATALTLKMYGHVTNMTLVDINFLGYYVHPMWLAVGIAFVGGLLTYSLTGLFGNTFALHVGYVGSTLCAAVAVGVASFGTAALLHNQTSWPLDMITLACLFGWAFVFPGVAVLARNGYEWHAQSRPMGACA